MKKLATLKKYLSIISVLLIFQSCFTVRKTVNYDQIPIVSPDNETKELFRSISDDTISMSLIVDLRPFKHKSFINDDVIIVSNKVSNQLLLDAEKILTQSKEVSDTLWLNPMGDEMLISLQKPLGIQYNRLKAKLIGVGVDLQNKEALLKLRANVFSLFGKNPKKITPSISSFPEAIDEIELKGELDLINFTKSLDNAMIRQRDLIPRFSRDAYWKGGTKILSVQNNRIRMRTRIKAEAWTKIKIPFGGRIKTRLWRHTSDATFTVIPSVDNYGKAQLDIVDFNFKHFPGEFDQKIKSTIQKKLKESGIDLNPKGFKTVFKKLAFSKINDSSLNVNFEFEID